MLCALRTTREVTMTGGTSVVRATGSCLCGAVRYEVHGPMRDVLFCHCRNCRRTHGHVSAYTSCRREDFEITDDGGLKWYHTDLDVTPNVQRGFCTGCGSSLFWDPQGYEFVYISAGTLDAPTHIKAAGHVWTKEAGDYYEISDDLPKAPASSHGAFLGTPHE
jgi:hypothetical protein